ncbi:zinc ribbon domain-containing protein [Allopseudospirillum japonicum]|uniref:zinc ribbon domain-containing protein n=1 Tax=Allopseudospirillum japonicum TaxID=64971 RepID=UPI000B811E0D
MFLTFLSYKCIDVGKNVLKIGRFEPSSKTCNHCNHQMETMLLSVRVWDCPYVAPKAFAATLMQPEISAI